MRQFVFLKAALLGFLALLPVVAAPAAAAQDAPVNAIEPEWDEFATGEIPPDIDETREALLTEDFLPQQPFDYVPARVRLSDELDREQRALVEAALAQVPGWTIGGGSGGGSGGGGDSGGSAGATHAIAPHPDFAEHLVFYAVKGASREETAALAPLYSREGEMSLVDMLDYYQDDTRKRDAWASNVPLPIHLGDPRREGFGTDLKAVMEPLARRNALLSLRSSYDPVASICLSEAPIAGSTCEIPRGRDWNEVGPGQNHYLAVLPNQRGPRHVTAFAVAPSGKVTLLMSQWAVIREAPSNYSGGATGSGKVELLAEYFNENGEKVSEFIDESGTRSTIITRYIEDAGAGSDAPSGEQLGYLPARAVASTGEARVTFEEYGRHQIIVISSLEPVNPAAFRLQPGDAAPPEWCSTPLELWLCDTLTGRNLRQFVIYDDLATFTIEVTEPIFARQVIINGFAASLAIAKWQAQLFVYRPGDPFFRSTQSPRLNFEKAHKCGGSYLGGGYILTAAHCIRDDLGEMRIRLGTRDIVRGGKTFLVHSVAVHKQASAASAARADIALIRIDDPRGDLASLRTTLAAVDIAGSDRYPTTNYSDLIVTGWGYMNAAAPGTSGPVAQDGSVQRNPRFLQGLELLAMPGDACTNVSGFGGFNPDDILCARGTKQGSDSCNGDSGGPVTSKVGSRRVLVGVVSVGKGCAQGTIPAIYMKVENFADWIAEARRELKATARGDRLTL